MAGWAAPTLLAARTGHNAVAAFLFRSCTHSVCAIRWTPSTPTGVGKLEQRCMGICSAMTCVHAMLSPPPPHHHPHPPTHPYPRTRPHPPTHPPTQTKRKQWCSGNILIAANPHKRLRGLYGPRMMAQYRCAVFDMIRWLEQTAVPAAEKLKTPHPHTLPCIGPACPGMSPWAS